MFGSTLFNVTSLGSMQIVTSLSADDFGAWESAKFAPEAKFLDKLKVTIPAPFQSEQRTVPWFHQFARPEAHRCDLFNSMAP